MEVRNESIIAPTSYTWSEIQQQPDLWPSTAERIRKATRELALHELPQGARVMLTGAGTSAYIASAIAAAWPKAIGVPSTDLLVDTERYLTDVDVLISVGRSGNSPESLAVVNRVYALRPQITQLAITCNSFGALAKSDVVRSVLLDPRTDDKSLVMTSSFSNLVIAGLCLAQEAAMNQILPATCDTATASFGKISDIMKRVASQVKERLVVLASSPMFAWAQEGSLKSLEMTSGRFPVLAETYLGLRHGPMSFVRRDTVVLCLLSNDSRRRRYEIDLVRELGAKNLGYLVGIGSDLAESDLFDEVVPAISPQVADELRTPFEIVAPQLLGYYLSLRIGLDPDNPSDGGIIHRVVQGVRIYEE